MPVPEDAIAVLSFILRVFALGDLPAVKKSGSDTLRSWSVVYLGKPRGLRAAIAILRGAVKPANKTAPRKGVTPGRNGLFGRALSTST
jgi:hypothetical protein